jgi:hypothetical protein
MNRTQVPLFGGFGTAKRRRELTCAAMANVSGSLIGIADMVTRIGNRKSTRRESNGRLATTGAPGPGSAVRLLAVGVALPSYTAEKSLRVATATG